MDQAVFVHQGQIPKKRLQQGEQLPGRDAAPLFDQVAEGGAIDVLHDDVGGVILLKEIPHTDNGLLLVHFGHGPGLYQILFLPPLKALGGGPHKAGDRQGNRGIPGGPVHRVILLDGHFQLQTQVVADVGDAKPALAQGAPHQVAAQQHRSRREMVGRGHIVPCGEAALGAALPWDYPGHTIGTKGFFHSGSPRSLS